MLKPYNLECKANGIGNKLLKMHEYVQRIAKSNFSQRTYRNIIKYRIQSQFKILNKYLPKD